MMAIAVFFVPLQPSKKKIPVKMGKIKRIICSLLIAITLTAVAQDVRMPVLHVYFDAMIVRDMPYTNGTMKLTDEDGKVVTGLEKIKSGDNLTLNMLEGSVKTEVKEVIWRT